jgi:hypothetical protein
MYVCFSKKFFLLLFCGCVLLQRVVLGSVGGTLIPFYDYPTASVIQPLLDAQIAHPNVPMQVILNPDTGPGQTQDPTYVSAIQAFDAVGIQSIGYVNTSNNARPIADVMSDILLWQTLYSPDGIFLDSMGSDLSYYQSLTDYIKGLGMQFSIGNAGGNVNIDYANVVDTVVIDTDNSLPILTDYADWQDSGLPTTAMAMLLYDITQFPPAFLFQAKQFVGWLYVTDANGIDPWDGLPTYFNLLMSALDTVDVGTIVPYYGYPVPAAIQPIINTANQYPNVPIWVILAPATNGPGDKEDPTYANAVTLLRGAGIPVLGYVNTNSSRRAQSAVEADIRTWISWYQPDGIFLDLMSVNHPYYSSITAYAKSLGIQVVVANPGENINPSAGKDVDIVNIFESGYLPSPLSQFSNWYDLYSPLKLSLIAYDIATLPTSFITEAAPYFGWIFVTDMSGVDPYSEFPTYFNSFIQLLSNF